jgi:hypothetical protein
MTNYKLVFKASTQTFQKRVDLPAFITDYLMIPLGYISRVDKKIIETKKGIQKYYQCFLELHSKDHRVMRFDFESRVDDCNNTH